MTWNVQNLFLPGQDAGPDTQAAFQTKLASLAAVIDQAAPDVAALQEVGPDDVLARLQAALTHPLPHAATGDPDDRGIRVALLSARPLAGVGVVGPFPDGVRAVQDNDAVFDDPATPGVDASMTRQMGRSALAATVEVDGTAVTVVAAHFKEQADQPRPQAGRGGRRPVRPQRRARRRHHPDRRRAVRVGDRPHARVGL